MVCSGASLFYWAKSVFAASESVTFDDADGNEQERENAKLDQ